MENIDKELWSLKDIWKFIKYKVSSLIPKRIISFHALMWICFIIAIYTVFNKNLIFQTKAIILSSIIFVELFFGTILEYLSGIHRHWWRTEHNIPSKGDIKKFKNLGGQENEKIQIGNNNE